MPHKILVKGMKETLSFLTLCWLSPKALLLQHCNQEQIVPRRNYVVLITVAPTADVSSLLLKVTKEEAGLEKGL